MASSLENWGEILKTQNLSSERQMDPVSKWLLITRASVFPMTFISGAIGGLLAVSSGTGDASFFYFSVALIGIVLAHAANNMINDYFDLEQGVDSEDYVRGQYAPHPVLSGLLSKKGLLLAIAVVNLLDLAIMLYLYSARGWPIVVFSLAGLFISVFYVAPPLKLKHRGLGEPGVAIVWGPLMIGGTYFATVGEFPLWVLLASLPYSLLVMAVLLGKHVDKFDADKAKGIHTLPVVLGKQKALAWTRGLMIAFFVLTTGLVLLGVFGVWGLVVLLGIPKLREVLETFSKPRPDSPPEDYPIWPLWYVAWAFLLTRTAGGLFVAGLVINAIWPWYLF
ncbi:MAG: prenyltransferase [bacterium]|nr:prenyltransferase [bacterium]